MRRGPLVLVAALLALGACHKPRTEIVLTVDSNLSVPAELDQVHVVVASEKSSTRFEQTYDLASGKTKLPIVLGLVPDADKKLGFRAVAQGLKNGVVVVERSAVTSFVPDQTLMLFLDLLRVCVQATCQTGETCGPQGVCVPETIKAADLPKYGTVRDAGSGVVQGDGGLPADATAADAGDGAGFIVDSGMATDHPADVGLEVVDAAPPVSDTSPVIKLDVQPTTLDATPPFPDTAPDVSDTHPAPDTAPDCPTVTVQRPPDGSPEGTRWAATVQATSTDGFCFKTCDTPIFAVTWKSFSGRTLTVNGNAVYLVGVDGKTNADTGTTETPPSAITGTGLRTFQVSAGASASASFTWYGGSIACPTSGPDAGPAISDTAPVLPDASPLPDTGPAIPCDKLGPWTSGAALAVPLPTTAYCFTLCFTAPARDSDGDGVPDALEYHWGCSGFTDADRTITINGQKMSCTGTNLSLPTEGEVVLTFVVSAGGHSGDSISWQGELHACP
ncbi:MAG: hypothetical protein JXP73_14575 [Deltaproteobacteria bacterium]|nr:hypothetical protein [Deltaproteobacteria bacterium]